ncbi:MAG TPA: FMN-binding negative transcriptional regulator [Rhizomicrobium sp.]|nr:FMN-binding negative transcriptional regulator [Rhizomicrobium sp.]
MYRPNAFAVDDPSVLREALRKRVFVTLAAVQDGALRFAYAPVMVGEGGVRFHLAIRNPLAALEDGMRVSLSCVAADAYVSPDWYRTMVTVPTWNYIAVEAEGPVRRLSQDELRALVIDLSAQEEAGLAPKPPWLIDKVPAPRIEAMLNAIVGFEMSFGRFEGKLKLSQDKPDDDVQGVIEGLEARGDPASLAVARAMREVKE